MMSVEKKRVSVTLTKPYLDALDRLVTEGIYMDRGTAIRAALRLLFTSHDIPPFARACSLCDQVKLESGGKRKKEEKPEDEEKPKEEEK